MSTCSGHPTTCRHLHLSQTLCPQRRPGPREYDAANRVDDLARHHWSSWSRSTSLAKSSNRSLWTSARSNRMSPPIRRSGRRPSLWHPRRDEHKPFPPIHERQQLLGCALSANDSPSRIGSARPVRMAAHRGGNSRRSRLPVRRADPFDRKEPAMNELDVSLSSPNPRFERSGVVLPFGGDIDGLLNKRPSLVSHETRVSFVVQTGLFFVPVFTFLPEHRP